MPDSLLCNPISPSFSNLVYATKQSTRRNVRSLEPLVQEILHPCRHRNSTGMACLVPSDRQWPSVPHAAEYGRSLDSQPHGAVRHKQVIRLEVLDHVFSSSARHLEPATIPATVRL